MSRVPFLRVNVVATDMWSANDLSKKLRVDTSTIRKAIDTWIDQGVLRPSETGNGVGFSTFVLIEVASDVPETAIRPLTSRPGMSFVFMTRVEINILSQSRHR